VVLLACVPLLLAPDVCTCDDGDDGPRHERHHHHACLGSLGLNDGDFVQVVPALELPPVPTSLVTLILLELSALPTPSPDPFPPPQAVPRYLSLGTLLI
jgi:hypothetical protein